MKIEEITSLAMEIVAHLKSINGDSATAETIGTRFKVGENSMRHILQNMEVQGMVRRITGMRHNRYYVATAEQLAAEAAYVAPRKHTTLRIDNQRAELYERLRKEREAIPSHYGEVA